MRISWIIVLTVVVTICAAQPQQRGRSLRPAERIESYKKVRMIEALALSEETGIKLVARYTAHREAVRKLEEERGERMDTIDDLVQSNASDAELQKSIAQIAEIEARILEMRKKYIESLKEILTVKQIAEYILFERNFMKDLRNVVRDVQKERSKK